MKTPTKPVRGKTLIVWPEFNMLDYNLSVLKNMNFYSIEIDSNATKKEWALDLWKSQGKNIKGVAKVPDSYFVTIGPVAHMIHHRELALNASEEAYCDKKYAELVLLVTVDDIVSAVKVSSNVANVEFRVHMAEFEYGIDMFFSGRVFDAKSYVIKHQINSTIIKRIVADLKLSLKEVDEAISGEDPDLVESYSFLTKKQLSKYSDYIGTLITSCGAAQVITKAAKRPKNTKVKPPSELVKSVKYKMEDTVSKLKSEHPSRIINTSEVWIYNAKNRRLFKCVALPGMKLSVKGVTIFNIDPEKSAGKTVRKPEIQLSGVQTLTSHMLGKLFSDIKSTQTTCTGRLNEDTLIVKCFN